MARRKKVSTTVSPEGYAFLREMIRSGKAETMAGALDLVLEEIRRADNRERLEAATAHYYETASPEAIEEENQLGAAFSAAAGEIDFDE
ncbi:MAG TPA: hypothetical protein VEG64_17620 [Candidatus Sulfotelmatobacter sp.]|nr:hypothetical protein [Candidatus Sulfotelmatobacter sp.]